MTHDRKPTRRMLLGTALALSVVLGASACSSGEDQTYSDGQQSEVQAQPMAKAKGTIDPGFTTPVTVEDKAQAKIDGVSSILSTDANGVLATNSARTKLMRVYGDQVAWTSADTSFETARFVQDGDRAWIVAVQKTDKETNVLVYDAFSVGADQEPIRKQKYGKDAQVVLGNNGIGVVDGQNAFKYSPRSGLSEPITLPGDSKLVTIVPSGYLMFKDNKASLVGEDGKEKWNSDSSRPEGMSPNTKVSVLAFAASTIVMQWEEGGKTVLTFLDANNGSLIASTTEPIAEDDSYALRSAQGAPYLYVGNLLVNVASEEVEVMDSNVTDVVDSIVYLEDGQGLDLGTLEPVWTKDNLAPVPNLIYQRTAFYIQDDSLYTFSLKGAVSSTSSPTEESEK